MKAMNKIRKVVSEMRKDVKAYNKHISDEFLDKLSYFELLNHTHPIYRPKYELALKKYGLTNFQKIAVCTE